MEKAGNSMTSHDMAKQILLKSFYFRQFPFISKKIWVLSSPVMTIYFRVFPKNGTAKSAMSWEVMELPPFSTEKIGQRGGGGVTMEQTIL